MRAAKGSLDLSAHVVAALLTEEGEDHLPAMRRMTVFPEEYSLPGPEQKFSLAEWHLLAGPGERHLDMARHIVRALLRVGEMPVVFRHESIEPGFEIAPG